MIYPCVYIFEIEHGFFKLGSSVNCGHRFHELQKWYEKNLNFIQAWKLPHNARLVEDEAHRAMKHYRSDKYGGKEVYACSRSRIVKAVRKAITECAKITIIRRQQMWAEGRKLQLPIGLGQGGIGRGRINKTPAQKRAS